MLKATNSNSLVSPYKFVKVEDFFSSYSNWQKLETVDSHLFLPEEQSLSLRFRKFDGSCCVMLIEFVQKNSFRLRFNPGKSLEQEFSSTCKCRTLATESFNEMKKFLAKQESFTLDFREQSSENGKLLVVTTYVEEQPFIKVIVKYAPFQISVIDCSEKEDLEIWKTASPSIYYRFDGDSDYEIIQSIVKPATAKFLGFGEHGGNSLFKNTAQINYFNYDNMRYRQVYNVGPLESREPLYHSDPVFMVANAIPSKDSTYGIFIDNPSQICVDIGYINSRNYMFGTRFGDLNYYFFYNNCPTKIIKDFTSVIGRPRLKPRYVLGYQQGCFGYESREDLEWVVRKYREFQIPLDGLHIDVDLQENYQTFTIDEKKFPNPKEMFATLRDYGVKCSTNITPIISNQNQNYAVYREGLENGYFVLDRRYQSDQIRNKHYQDYSGGNEYYVEFNDEENEFDSGRPYTGEVYYGQDEQGQELGTTGHYPDLGRADVRHWWGQQYQYLFDMGLEMVWQDMTTPSIRPTKGDMRGFPFTLLVTDDFTVDSQQNKNLAIKVWNSYSYNLHKATYHGLNNLKGRENKRNFIIGRGSFAGMHRFAGLWAGDNASTWDFLRMNVSQVLSIGLSGLAINGEDAGGFEPEKDEDHWVDPELLIRWMSVSSLLPWFRNHYIRKGKKFFQEPFMFEEWFKQNDASLPEPQELYQAVYPVCKYYIELRYQLLQLFYDAMFENTLNGMPICRPMFLNDNYDKSLYNDKISFLRNQFFVRRDLLVAPLLEQQSESNNFGHLDVYLPAGSDWYCFMNNRSPLLAKIKGGTTIRDFDAHIDANGDHVGFIVPMFVRAGAILPTIELEQYVGELNLKKKANPITFNIYPGSKGQYTLYLDDGVSRSSAPQSPFQNRSDEYANSEYRETLITHEYLDNKIREIRVERVHDNYTPVFEKHFLIAILHDPSESSTETGPIKKVSINSQYAEPIDSKDSNRLNEHAQELNLSLSNSWYYNYNTKATLIKVFDNNPFLSIRVEYV